MARTNGRRTVRSKNDAGFTLLEMLIALTILSFGLLAAGQMLYAAFASASLSRSKENAAVAAQNEIEALADLYRRDPAAPELTMGSHGPRIVQVTNQLDGTVLNRFGVTWTVSPVPDPRAGKTIAAKMVTAAATPVNAQNESNSKASLNKTVSIGAVFSPIIR